MKPMNSARCCALLAWTFITTACSGGPLDEPSTLRLIARSAGIPYTRSDALVLIAEDRACMTDSYSQSVYCGGRSDWIRPLRIGASGDGPGEFRRPSRLIRGGDDEIGVIASDRLHLFTSGGEFLRSVSVPLAFEPLGYVSGDRLLGAHPTVDPVSAAVVSWVDLTGDSVTRSALIHAPRPRGDLDRIAFGLLVDGVVRNDGSVVIRGSGGDYVLDVYAANGEWLHSIERPEFRRESASERDREKFTEDLRSMSGYAPPQQQIDELAAKPRGAILPGGLALDSSGVLWVATSRDHDDVSYIDRFSGDRFLGSVRIPGRLRAYDILGGTLAALVERETRNGDGVYPLTIDWYRIDE